MIERLTMVNQIKIQIPKRYLVRAGLEPLTLWNRYRQTIDADINKLERKAVPSVPLFQFIPRILES